MVMLTEILQERAAEKRRADRLRPWSFTEGLKNDEKEATAPKFGVRLSDMLSADSQSFVERQWQPYGE
jgi:hypothetical protein